MGQALSVFVLGSSPAVTAAVRKELRKHGFQTPSAEPSADWPRVAGRPSRFCLAILDSDVVVLIPDWSGGMSIDELAMALDEAQDIHKPVIVLDVFGGLGLSMINESSRAPLQLCGNLHELLNLLSEMNRKRDGGACAGPPGEARGPARPRGRTVIIDVDHICPSAKET